jgi:hypothetical protein
MTRFGKREKACPLRALAARRRLAGRAGLLLSVVLFVASLTTTTACSGGGASEASATDTPTATATSAPAPPPAGAEMLGPGRQIMGSSEWLRAFGPGSGYTRGEITSYTAPSDTPTLVSFYRSEMLAWGWQEVGWSRGTASGGATWGLYSRDIENAAAYIYISDTTEHRLVLVWATK